MGRIKTKLIKRTGNKLYNEHKENFTNKFDKNKIISLEFMDTSSKKLRNTIVGYITRLARQQK